MVLKRNQNSSAVFDHIIKYLFQKKTTVTIEQGLIYLIRYKDLRSVISLDMDNIEDMVYTDTQGLI